jgi:hypothetical protein
MCEVGEPSDSLSFSVLLAFKEQTRRTPWELDRDRRLERDLQVIGLASGMAELPTAVLLVVFASSACRRIFRHIAAFADRL